MTAAASTPDILRAVERWARVDRCWRPGESLDKARWSISRASRDRFTVWSPGGGTTVEVSPAIALAWAILESEAAPVDVGRCRACVARSGRHAGRFVLATWEWKDVYASDDEPGGGWHGGMVYRHRGRKYWPVARPCPACTGTGRETIPVERLLLDAVSGDADALARMSEQADRLQANGEPLGTLLAWALYLWTGEPTEQTCPRCNGNPPAYGTGASRKRRCDACNQTDRQLGHPHTAEAVAWLDRLTAERESAEDGDRLQREEARALSTRSALSFPEALGVIQACVAAGVGREQRSSMSVRELMAAGYGLARRL